MPHNNIWYGNLTKTERYLVLFLVWRYESLRQCIGLPLPDSAVTLIADSTGIARDEAIAMLTSFVERKILVPTVQVENRTTMTMAI